MWKDIEEIDWANRSNEHRGYKSAKRYVLENFTKKRVDKLRDFVYEKAAELHIAINKYEKETGRRVGKYGGDDSFDDMVHHTIGLGEEYFNAVMADPKLLDELDFVESFAYCLPYDDDFETIKDGYFENEARECLYELARILKDNNPSPEDVKVILGLVKRFGSMAEGDFEKAVGDFDGTVYDTAYQFESNDCMALFANILSDCKELKL